MTGFRWIAAIAGFAVMASLAGQAAVAADQKAAQKPKETTLTTIQEEADKKLEIAECDAAIEKAKPSGLEREQS